MFPKELKQLMGCLEDIDDCKRLNLCKQAIQIFKGRPTWCELTLENIVARNRERFNFPWNSGISFMTFYWTRDMHEAGKWAEEILKWRKETFHQFYVGKKNIIEFCKAGETFNYFFSSIEFKQATIFLFKWCLKVIFLTWNYTTLIILSPGIGIYFIFRQILAPDLWRDQENVQRCN